MIHPFNGQDIHEVYRWDERMTMEVMRVGLGTKWDEIYGRLRQVITASFPRTISTGEAHYIERINNVNGNNAGYKHSSE